MTSEELFVLVMTLATAFLALVIYLKVKIAGPGKVGLTELRTGWLLFSVSAILLCGYKLLRFESSNRRYALTIILISVCVSLIGLYKCMFPVRNKHIDDSTRLERYLEEYRSKRDAANHNKSATPPKGDKTSNGDVLKND
jgi:hypothetical protein